MNTNENHTTSNLLPKGNMKRGARLRFFLVITMHVVGLTWQSSAQESLKLSIEQVGVRSGVILRGGNEQPIGSGFVFGSQKDVGTCWHVKNGAEVIFHETNLVFLSGMSRYKLHLKYMLPRYDLAVFSTSPEIKTEAFKPGDFKKLRPGNTIWYVGFDVRQSSQFNAATIVNTSQIAAVGSALNDGVVVDFLEFAGVGIPGYSGGAVFNANGELVAIMREAWTKKGVSGGTEMLINRAFSIEILGVLNEQLFTDPFSGSASTNATQIGIMDVLNLTNRPGSDRLK